MAIIRATSAKARPGEEAKIDVVLENNPGVIAVRLFVEFDGKNMPLTGFVDSGLLERYFHAPIKAPRENSPYVLFWENGTRKEDITEDGTAVTLTFKVSENAPKGRYRIGLSSPSPQDIINFHLKPVSFEIVGGEIEVY